MTVSPPKSDDSAFDHDRDVTGLPLLGTWRAVYVFVLASLLVFVLLLTVFTRTFS